MSLGSSRKHQKRYKSIVQLISLVRYKKCLTSSRHNTFYFINNQGRVSFGSKNPPWPIFLEILFRGVDFRGEKLKKGVILPGAGDHLSIRTGVFPCLFLFGFTCQPPQNLLSEKNWPLKLGVRALRGNEMKIDSGVGPEEKRYGLWVTESGSWEEEDSVRLQKVLDKGAEKGSVAEWMSRSPEKASKATLQDRPSPAHRMWAQKVLLAQAHQLPSSESLSCAAGSSGPPIPEVLIAAAGPGSLLRLPEAPGLSQCPDLMSSSLESAEGPGRKETC